MSNRRTFKTEENKMIKWNSFLFYLTKKCSQLPTDSDRNTHDFWWHLAMNSKNCKYRFCDLKSGKGWKCRKIVTLLLCISAELWMCWNPQMHLKLDVKQKQILCRSVEPVCQLGKPSLCSFVVSIISPSMMKLSRNVNREVGISF